MATGPDLKYTRGDTRPIVLAFKDEAGADLDMSGYTGLVLSINPEPAPVPTTNNIDSMPGTFVNTGVDGRVAFVPSGVDETAKRATSEGYVTGPAYYDVQGINAAGQRDTILDPGGNFNILEGITV
jgi:hypothetical protein